MKFLDETWIQVTSGSGGDGHVSFRRERFVARGGPDGGRGGKGGAVILEASARKNTLVDYHRARFWRAENGENGGRKQMTGAAGADRVLPVPLGTLVYDDADGRLLADLDHEGARLVIPGGRGGLGNMNFRSSTNRTPRQYTPGQPGVEVTLRLELKLLADVGLLGLPNAGKSTFLARVSAARPKVADYPFTTLVPQLGVVAAEGVRPFVIADIPGLVEGAADGAGLGHQFLRHVERCAAHLHLVAIDPWSDEPEAVRFDQINAELRAYGGDVADTVQLVALTKIDVVPPHEVARRCAALEEAAGCRVFPISSVTGQGVAELLKQLGQFVAGRHATAPRRRGDPALVVLADRVAPRPPVMRWDGPQDRMPDPAYATPEDQAWYAAQEAAEQAAAEARAAAMVWDGAWGDDEDDAVWAEDWSEE
jgi:GTP-binding protein